MTKTILTCLLTTLLLTSSSVEAQQACQDRENRCVGFKFASLECAAR